MMTLDELCEWKLAIVHCWSDSSDEDSGCIGDWFEDLSWAQQNMYGNYRALLEKKRANDEEDQSIAQWD